jgi:hypothetical protein
MTHNVPVIGQAVSMGCWAAAFSMMYSWRQMASMSIPVTLRKLGGSYVQAYDRNTGIPVSTVQDAVNTLGLRHEAPMNPTTMRWLQLVGASPLFVVVNEELNPGKFAVHARVVIDINSDSTHTVTYIDPAANSLEGGEASQSLAQFVNFYEHLAGTGWAGLQIIHYGG